MPRGRCVVRPLLLASLVVALPGSISAQGARCEAGLDRGRASAILSTQVVAETAVLLVRGPDWWAQPNRGFHVVWDRSTSGGQNHLLHATIALHLARASGQAWTLACATPWQQRWLPVVQGLMAVLPKEIGDGFQERYGFSAYSVLWTAAGTAIPLLWEMVPPTRAFQLKFSYFPSSELRNRVGGQPQFESDYAGQRYYLAFQPADMPGWPDGWPEWLGGAIGHSVDQWFQVPLRHEWYLALDLDLRRLPIRSAWWPRVASVLNAIHLPLPGIRLRGGGLSIGLF